MPLLAHFGLDTLLSPQVFPWVAFNAFVVVMLVLDLFVFHRHAHVIRVKEALLWSAFWVSLGLAFTALLYALNFRGNGKATSLQFLTGYVVEQSLSVDNLFVFLLLFSYFKVPPHHQHRVLFWGILGAVVMRVLFIVVGSVLINHLHWVMYAFGAFLVFAGVRMAVKSDDVDPEKNLVLRLCKRFLRVTPEYHEGHFFVRSAGHWLATPLLVVLLVVETTDVVFAVDSVPAVLGVIRDPVTGYADPFIAYSSNVMAILGLRAMYFALAGLMQTFHLLHYGLAAILVFVGGKMVVEAGAHYGLPSCDIPTGVALGVIAGVLALSGVLSLVFPQRNSAVPPRPMRN